MRYDRFCVLLVLSLCLIVGGGVTSTVSAPQTRLWAPTYYIAARGTYDGRPDELYVVGASNLPIGARLYLNVYRYIGEGGDAISESASAVVGKEGFFEATLHPRKGNQFQHNLVCDIVFATRTDPPQPSSVLQVVGNHGEHLGFPKNPQIEVTSGENFTLTDRIHVP
jgi:hypothetical protein